MAWLGHIGQQDIPAWTQALGSIAAIVVSVWLAGRPARAAEKAHMKVLSERIYAISRAAAILADERAKVARAILDRDGEAYERASALLDSSDHYEVRSVMKLPVEHWPSVSLHGAMARLQDAAAEFDQKIGGQSWNVIKANSHVFHPRAREMQRARELYLDEFIKALG